MVNLTKKQGFRTGVSVHGGVSLAALLYYKMQYHLQTTISDMLTDMSLFYG